MSPRQTRTATTMDQSPERITTRSKAQKINNKNIDIVKSVERTRQSQKKEKRKNIKNDLEVSIKERESPKTPKRESPKTKKKYVKSVKKKGSRRKLKLTEEMEISDKSTQENLTQENLNTNSNELDVQTELEGKVRDKNSTSIQMKKLSTNNSSPLNNSKDSKQNNKTPNKKLKWKIVLTGVKISPSMITPKSTPPRFSLTPHRSKKTPKKSPISLGSPKTHTKAVPRLFKSPRKLSLSTISGLENIDNSSVNLKSTVQRFSKQPKVLKSGKSKKSKSPSKLRLSSSSPVTKDSLKMSIATPNTTPDLDSTKSPRTSTSSPKSKTLSLIKRRLLKSKVMKLMTASQVRDVLAEPVVLLEKLPAKNIQSMSTISRTKSNTSIKVKSPLINKRNSSKILTPIITKSPVKSPMFNRNSGSKLNHSRAKGSTNRISPRAKDSTLIQKKDRSSIPLMSSTPREEKMPLMDMDLTSNTPIVPLVNISLNTRSSHRSQSNTQLSGIMDRSTIIANISEPSLIDKSSNDASRAYISNGTIQQVADGDATEVLQKEQENKDNTYELEQPQTLDLQRMIRKRTSTDANLTPKMDNKKTKKVLTASRSKVRFANATPSTNSAHKSIKWTASQSNISHNNTRRSSVMNSTYKLKQRETPKFHRNSFKRKSSPSKNESMPTTRLSMTQNTPKTFGSVTKKSEKKSSVKKKPNFAKIHEKMFAKSESVVDARKRLELRHAAFTVNKIIPKIEVKKEETKPLPTDTNDGTHNRFGFKLRKAEATNIMLKKQSNFSRNISRPKQQQETRMMLKGVRTNRRFELQMKSRNLNA